MRRQENKEKYQRKENKRRIVKNLEKHKKIKEQQGKARNN